MKRFVFSILMIMGMVSFVFTSGCSRLSSKDTAELLNEGLRLATSGKWDKAHKYASAAVKRDPNSQYTQLFLAFTSEHNQKKAQALTAAENAVEIAPNSFIAQYTLGRLYNEQNKVQEALKPLLEAHNLKPSDPYNILLLAEVYRKMNAAGTAMNYYNKLIRNHPTFMADKANAAWIWNQLAVIYTGLDNNRNAASCLKQAYTLAPQNPAVLLNFAIFLERIKSGNRAVAYYREYLKLTEKDQALAEKHELVKKRISALASH
ncbi:MAG: tetratricopeptide repeat protein [Victivallaceae bacterium]|nr:tetratricopeptide repeat protein [Victivallaceae bacterium]MDD4181437.1 tetratricopeptide repeat protein [Victivallaceae bacterium]